MKAAYDSMGDFPEGLRGLFPSTPFGHRVVGIALILSDRIEKQIPGRNIMTNQRSTEYGTKDTAPELDTTADDGKLSAEDLSLAAGGAGNGNKGDDVPVETAQQYDGPSGIPSD